MAMAGPFPPPGYNSRYSQPELQQLMQLAGSFVIGPNGEGYGEVCNFFYRNKPPSYFSNIMNTTGFMDPALKDYGGDPRNPINGRLAGVFLSARHELPSMSPFGSKRILIDAKELFDIDCSLFFSDFYCLFSAHYIQLVLTPDDLVENYPILTEKLVELNISNNPFLWIDDGDIFVTVKDVWVEVFYTESIFINDLIYEGSPYFFDTPTFGQGSSTPGGLKKKMNCPICNLPPPPPPPRPPVPFILWDSMKFS